MTTNRVETESIKAVDRHPGQKCGNCRHSIPASEVGSVWCFVAILNKQHAEHCRHWQTMD